MSGPDDIERRLREIEAEFGPARVKEPSAAERAGQLARKPGWRSARKARKLRRPVTEPPRGSQPSRRASRRGRIWSLVVAVVVLACIAGATVAIITLAKHPPKVAAGKTPSPSSHPTTGAASNAFLPSPTLAAPFLGTPAQSYANGAAGIAIPPVHAVGTYSAAQVAAAYQATKRLLIAANLNPPTLRGGSTSAYAGLLVAQQRASFVDGLGKTGFNPDGSQRSTRTWITSFAPGSTQFVGSVIKVHGAMRARTAANGNSTVLRIHADYLFVYPVERPGQPLTLTRIVVRYVVNYDFATYDDPGGPLEPWLRTVERFDAGAQCREVDGFVHPYFPGGIRKGTPTGSPTNPYDQSTLPSQVAGCHATTGT
jgi:hypothetical protein